MARYFASPFGTIIGKVNGQVGCRWRGQNVIKKYTVPADKGTLLKYQQYKDGIIPPSSFSFPQFNLRRLVINPLMHISRDAPTFISDVWKLEANSRKLMMSGQNLIMQANISQLYASFDPTIEFDPVTNTPDLTKLVMSQGILEGATGFGATYDTGTGIVTFEWDPAHYQSGKDDDFVSFVILAKPILESIGRAGNWKPALKIYYFKNGDPPPAVAPVRADGTGQVTIDTGLDPNDLFGFIFFFQVTALKTITSESISGTVLITP